MLRSAARAALGLEPELDPDLYGAPASRLLAAAAALPAVRLHEEHLVIDVKLRRFFFYESHGCCP